MLGRQNREVRVSITIARLYVTINSPRWGHYSAMEFLLRDGDSNTLFNIFQRSFSDHSTIIQSYFKAARLPRDGVAAILRDGDLFRDGIVRLTAMVLFLRWKYCILCDGDC